VAGKRANGRLCAAARIGRDATELLPSQAVPTSDGRHTTVVPPRHRWTILSIDGDGTSLVAAAVAQAAAGCRTGQLLPGRPRASPERDIDAAALPHHDRSIAARDGEGNPAGPVGAVTHAHAAGSAQLLPGGAVEL